MSKRSIAVGTLGLGVFLMTSIAQADQAAWIEKKDADAGAALITAGKELRGYCAPCHDSAYTSTNVTSVAVAQPNPGYWEVRVNGRGVDLAYEYVLVNGRWINVAMAIGLNVTGVPAELPPSVPRK